MNTYDLRYADPVLVPRQEQACSSHIPRSDLTTLGLILPCSGDLAMATMWRATATQHQAGADGAPPQPGAGSGSHPPSPNIHVGTGTQHCELKYLASDRLPDLGRVEPPSDSWLPSPTTPPPPPAPAPAPARTPDRKDPHDLRVNPKVRLALANRFAVGVLEHYNKKKKIKFELLDAKHVISIPEPHCCYTHINFTARSSKEDSQEQLFFAEIYHCRKKRAPSGFIVTCCEPLGPDFKVGQKFHKKPDGTSAVRKNTDFTYCFACTESMLHPSGENYVAGHCNIPRIYDYLR